MNETTTMRLTLSAAIGAGVFVATGLGVLVVKAAKQEIGVAIPITAAISTAVTVYVIDTLTERRSRAA